VNGMPSVEKVHLLLLSCTQFISSVGICQLCK
jgi:hypothetical protein